MTKIDTNISSDDLRQLLDDVCKFFSDEALAILPPQSKLTANSLVDRSKMQLQKISKIYEYHSYVDMQGNKGSAAVEEDDNTYASLAECKQKEEFIHECPCTNLPVKNIPIGSKSGPLTWKTKLFLNFEKNKPIYAAVYSSFMLIYENDKDLKPTQTFDLKISRAKPVDKCKDKKSFLLCLDSTKSFTFTALNHTDMLEWTTAINAYETETEDGQNDAANLQIKNSEEVITPLKVPGPTLPPRPENRLLPATSSTEANDLPLYDILDESEMDYDAVQAPTYQAIYDPVLPSVQKNETLGSTEIEYDDIQNFEQIEAPPVKPILKPIFLKIKFGKIQEISSKSFLYKQSIKK